MIASDSSSSNLATKSIVTVRELARMVSLSPRRLYQLIDAGVFPPPTYSVTTRKPGFTEEQQEVCLEVRRRHCGINGQPVFFYARHIGSAPLKPKPQRKAPVSQAVVESGRYEGIRAGLAALGLEAVTDPLLNAAIRAEYPAGIANADEGEVIRRVFLHLKRQNSAEKLV